MEKARNEKIKEFFLAAFLLVCVGMILALWAKALLEKDVETPYFYREAPQLSEAYYATRTAIAEQVDLGTGTPAVETKHRESTPIAIATVTPDVTLDPFFTPESDN